MQWNIIQPYKGMDYCYVLQHRLTSEILSCVGEAKPKWYYISYDTIYMKCQKEAKPETETD
jgi:hypothetical protein